MARRRFYVPVENISGDEAVLPPPQAHHLRDVLRLMVGEQVELFDGRGNSYAGTITDIGKEVSVGGLKRLDVPLTPQPRLVLAAAVIKFDRFEWMLEKTTELGVDEFIPLTTRFTGIRIPEHRLEGRMRRWERILTEAARQSGRLDVPVIRKPLEFSKFLKADDTATLDRLMFFEGADQLLVSGFAESAGAVLCIGPEGGWDQSEVEAAADTGYRVFSLGRSILRSETAAIAAVALFRFQVSSTIAGIPRLQERGGG
jgi:16S rRNA (uracil1498-N3)-methyltransferase